MGALRQLPHLPHSKSGIVYIAVSGRLFVYCGYAGIGPPSATRDPSSVAVYSATDQARSRAIYTQSPSASVNRVYDSKAQRYAEDNRTESNCTHW